MAGGARFPRRARLTGRQAFAGVFAQPSQIQRPLFHRACPTQRFGYPRLGLAISRKVAKSAVARNRFKRIGARKFPAPPAQISAAWTAW
jgi:ribonuclease P protein component